jgi:hypothetical protein
MPKCLLRSAMTRSHSRMRSKVVNFLLPIPYLLDLVVDMPEFCINSNIPELCCQYAKCCLWAAFCMDAREAPTSVRR